MPVTPHAGDVPAGEVIDARSSTDDCIEHIPMFRKTAKKPVAIVFREYYEASSMKEPARPIPPLTRLAIVDCGGRTAIGGERIAERGSQVRQHHRPPGHDRNAPPAPSRTVSPHPFPALADSPSLSLGDGKGPGVRSSLSPPSPNPHRPAGIGRLDGRFDDFEHVDRSVNRRRTRMRPARAARKNSRKNSSPLTPSVGFRYAGGITSKR